MCPWLKFFLNEWQEGLSETWSVSLAACPHPFLAQNDFFVWMVLAATGLLPEKKSQLFALHL